MTVKEYRIGVIGFAHMHVNTLIDTFDKLPNTTWVACADTAPLVPSLSVEPGTRIANLQRAKEVTGIPRQYQDYQVMLDQEQFDIIILCSENSRHAEIIEKVAAKGVHVVVEKPLATKFEEAWQIERATKKYNVTVATNWPSTWWPGLRKGRELVDKGEIGEVWKFKYANAASLGPLEHGQVVSDKEKGEEWWHQKAMGGGALFDYCSYGACLSRWFIGESALQAQGFRANFHSPYGDADDNSIITARFPNAVAILEGSWSTPRNDLANGPIVYGSEGLMVCERDSVKIYKKKSSGGEPIIYQGDDLPKGRQNIAEELIFHLETGKLLHPTLDISLNLDATAILDAGIRAANTHKLELVKNVQWN